MSKNAKKQTGKPQSGSRQSTQSEPKPADAPKSNESEQTAQNTDELKAGEGVDTNADNVTPGTGEGNNVNQPSGATMETGAGDPSTDAPASAQEGATEPEDTVNGQADDDSDDNDADEPRNSPLGGAKHGTTYGQLDGPVDDNTASVEWQGVPEEGAPKGRILEANEEPSFEGERIGNAVIVKEDVYRKVYPRGATRPSYILVYRKGTQVPATAVQGSNPE